MILNEIVLMSDPRIAAVEVDECREPLVDVRGSGAVRVDQRKADAAGAFAHVRSGVLKRLERAQASLPYGLHLLFVEGYRPPALQGAYFAAYAGTLRDANPAWSEGEVFAAASRYVSPPDIAPHSCGAAVDLTLADDDGRELDMGTRVNASPEESAGRCYTAADAISDRAAQHRQLLGAALTSAGLVNYPTEWWHWSYGDRYWGLLTGSTAIYGPTELAR